MSNEREREDTITEDGTPDIQELIVGGEEEINGEAEQRVIESEASYSRYTGYLLEAQIKEIKENIILKKIYTKIFLIIMIEELIFINIIVLLQGLGLMKLDKSIFNVFLIGVFTQIVSIITIIFNNIFPKDHDKNLIDFHKKVFNNTSYH